MSESHIIDVKKVIEDSSQVKTIQELEQEGRRAVKVVRASRISELISQAVDNVIRDRSLEVVEAERNQMIHATSEEFRKLLQDADSERRKNEEQRARAAESERELLEIKHKLDLAEHVHTEDLRLLEEQKAVVDELKEKVLLLKQELELLVKRHQGESEERDELRSELGHQRELNRRLHSEIEAIRSVGGSPAPEADDSIKDLAQEVKAIRDSFEKKLPEQGGSDEKHESHEEMISKLEGVIHSSMDQIVKQLATQVQATPGGGFSGPGQPVEAARVVLDNIFTENDDVESNFGNIAVESSESSGIGGNLERLKNLHAKGIGGSGGESTPEDDRSARKEKHDG